MLKHFIGIEKYYVACGKTDMRMGIEGLASKISSEFKLNPLENSAFFFCGNRKDRIKILVWEGDGFLLMYKRIESGKIQWPRTSKEAKLITKQQLEWLLTGLYIEATSPITKLNLLKDNKNTIDKLLNF